MLFSYLCNSKINRFGEIFLKKNMTQEELKNYLKENLKISFITKSRKVFGCSPKKLIQLKLEDELISETEIYDWNI